MVAFTGQKMGSVGCYGSQNEPEGKFSTEPLSWGTDYKTNNDKRETPKLKELQDPKKVLIIVGSPR